MSKETTYPKDIFTSLSELLKMERYAHYFSYLARKQRVNSILAGKHTSKLRGRGLDFEEVRHYVKGDDIRNIDWKVTARTKETHTRVYTEEKEKPVLIVVDQSKSMFFGSEKRTKSVVAAELAAVCAFRVLKEGDRVGGIVFADKGIDYIAPKRSRKSILHFLDKVVTRNHELKESDPVVFEEALETTLMRVKNVVTHDFTVIIVSDFIRYDQRVIKALRTMALHNDVILAKVYDPLEKKLPNISFVAGNQSHQITVQSEKKKIDNAYKELYASNFKTFQVEMKKHKIPVFEIDTVLAVDQQIKELFGSIRK